LTQDGWEIVVRIEFFAPSPDCGILQRLRQIRCREESIAALAWLDRPNVVCSKVLRYSYAAPTVRSELINEPNSFRPLRVQDVTISLPVKPERTLPRSIFL